MRKAGWMATAAALLLSTPAAAQLPDDYPAMGRAIDAMVPAADYSDVMAERPRSVSIMRSRAHGFVPSAEMDAYVTSILTRLLDGVPLPATFSPDVRILAAPDYNALCTPDGTLVVSMGLLEQSETADEIAFILGHEVAHAILKHHDSDWALQSQYYAIMSAQSLSTVASGIQAAGGSALGGLSGALGGLQRGVVFATKVYELSENVLAPRYQQGQEDQADALGLDLMIRAGYNPDGAQRALQRLALAEEAAQRAAEEAEAARVEEEQQGGGGLFGGGGGGGGLFGGGGGGGGGGGLFGGGGGGGGGGGMLSGMLGGVNVGGIGTLDIGAIADEALDVATDQMAEDAVPHRPATERADFLVEYQFREYRDLIPGDVVTLPWAPGAPAATNEQDWALAATVANYRAANVLVDHLQGLQGGDVQTSAGYAVQAPTTNHAYTQFALARLRDSETDIAAAHAARAAALQSPEPSWIAYNSEIDDRIAQSDFAGADTVMQEAVIRFEDSPVLLPKRILIQTRLGNTAEAQRLLAQCDGYDIRELHDQCEAATQ